MTYLWSFLLLTAATVQGTFSETRNCVVILGSDGRPLNEVSRNPGESVVLNCSILSGGPATIITWKRGLSLDLRSSQGASTWLDYKISSVLENDHGLYRCIAMKSGEKLRGITSVFLNVNGRPKITHGTSTFQINYMGDTGTFSCYASGWPQPSLQWKFNGMSLRDGDLNNSTFLTTTSNGKGIELRISTFKQEHDGMFTCEAMNNLGKASLNVESIVKYRVFEVPPEVKVTKFQVQVKLNSSAELECKADFVPLSDPHCPVVWKFNDITLSNNKAKYNLTRQSKKRVVGTYYAMYQLKSILKVRYVSPRDAGVYTCQVVTYFGHKEGHVKLTVN